MMLDKVETMAQINVNVFNAIYLYSDAFFICLQAEKVKKIDAQLLSQVLTNLSYVLKNFFFFFFFVIT